MNKQQAALEILCALIANDKHTAYNELVKKAVKLANQLQEELDKHLMGDYFSEYEEHKSRVNGCTGPK